MGSLLWKEKLQSHPMEQKVNEILSSTNKRQYLIDVLDRLLKETDFYGKVLEKSEELMEGGMVGQKEICSRLCEYVYENMPESARLSFESEVRKFIDQEVHPNM